MELQGYMICLLLSKKKHFFRGKSYQTGYIVVSGNVHPTLLFRKGVETNCNKKLYTLKNLKHHLL